jgi:hypothetical protein
MPTYPQMTLAEIRTQARQRADMVVSQFVTDAELNGWINSSLAELYDLLIQKYGDDYFVELYSFSTGNGVDRYDLPTNFYKLLGVDLFLTGNDPDQGAITLRPFTFAERNRYATANAQTWLGITNLRYRLSGSKLWLTPTPQGEQTIRLWYVPRVVPLVNDADVADGVSGWLEYVVVDVAIKAMQKEESDVSVLLAQKVALIQRIESAAENRDAGSPATVADVQSTSGAWPYNAGLGGGWTL